MFDGKAFGEEMTAIVKGYVERATAPLVERIAALEARPAPEKGDTGERGADGRGVADAGIDDGILVLRLTDGEKMIVGQVAGADGQDGKDAEPPTPDAVAETFRPMAEEIVSEAVAAGLAKVPPPEKGEKGDQGEVGAAGADGRGWAKSFIDRDGNLVATFTDGSTENLGCIVGKDGQPGRDGFSLEDFDVIPVDERTVELKFAQNGTAHSYELVFPVPVYRGVFKEGEAYQRGDMVTWGGSVFYAEKETSAKPDSADSGFKLAVKRGRDGKDAKAA
jgi:hypothetical protein